MKWIKKLLFGTPKVYPSDDRISNLSVDKEGNISATATLSVNGEKLAIPLSANAEELEQILRNKNNPQSCERKPDNTEIMLSVSGFFEKYKHGLMSNEISDRVWSASIRAKYRGYNYFIASKKDIEYIIGKQNALLKNERALRSIASINMKGKELEKEGHIEEAIKLYEENLTLGYPATYSYERLMVLYRKLKDIENEKRVIKLAIRVFLAENERRARKCLEKYPEREEEIYNALTSCSNIMGDNGFYILVLYDVIKYRNRLNKLTSNTKK